MLVTLKAQGLCLNILSLVHQGRKEELLRIREIWMISERTESDSLFITNMLAVRFMLLNKKYNCQKI
jgi:hypothetical protein